MIAIRRVLLAGLATLLLAGACTTGITIPSIPPIVIPSFPPIVLPSGIVIPSSADPNSGICLLVTPAEVSAIMGAQATVTDNSGDGCTYTLPNFSTVVLSTSTDSDLTGPKFLLGNTAKDITVGNYPAVSGVFIGQPAVFVQRGPGQQLEVLGILTGSDDATVAKIVQVAQTAAGRWQ